jgi:hypothetical protein
MLYYTHNVYTYYVCIIVKSALSGSQNQHFNYTTRCITLHKTSRVYIHFWKRVFSNHGGSTEATRGCGRIQHVFWRIDQHVCLWYFAHSLWVPPDLMCMDSATCIPLVTGLVSKLCGTQPINQGPRFWAHPASSPMPIEYLPPGLQRSSRETPYNAKVKNAWSYTSSPCYVNMVWYLLKHRAKCATWTFEDTRFNIKKFAFCSKRLLMCFI